MAVIANTEVTIVNIEELIETTIKETKNSKEKIQNGDCC